MHLINGTDSWKISAEHNASLFILLWIVTTFVDVETRQIYLNQYDEKINKLSWSS